MLSSCKNTAWEKSKCLRHPQLPGPVLPRSELGPGRETPWRTRTLSSDGERRLLQKWREGSCRPQEASGWKPIACFGHFPF